MILLASDQIAKLLALIGVVSLLSMSASVAETQPSLKSSGTARDLSQFVSAELKRDVLQRSGQSPDAAAESGLAAVAAAEQGVTGAADRVRELADHLIALSDLAQDGRAGWSLDATRTEGTCNGPGTLATSLNPAACNPKYTKYTYQTAYALTFLLRAYILTRNTRYLKVAQAALDAAEANGETLKHCRSCFYYWYSYTGNDHGRYVRNTNALMGMAAAWAWKATGDEKYRRRALSVAAAEKREFAAGNFGYFGIDDPKYIKNPAVESQYMESHAMLLVKADFDMARLLKDRTLLDDIVRYWTAWDHCHSETCLRFGCASWGAPPQCQRSFTYTPCAIAAISHEAHNACDRVVQEAVARRSQALPPYAIWTLLDQW